MGRYFYNIAQLRYIRLHHESQTVEQLAQVCGLAQVEVKHIITTIKKGGKSRDYSMSSETKAIREEKLYPNNKIQRPPAEYSNTQWNNYQP